MSSYGFATANPTSTPLYIGTTQVTVQTLSWASDSSANYTLRWAGEIACPSTLGVCTLQIVFNGVTISGPTNIQSPTNCWSLFCGAFWSSCANQVTSGTNVMTVLLTLVGTGNAKVKESYIEYMQTA